MPVRDACVGSPPLCSTTRGRVLSYALALLLAVALTPVLGRVPEAAAAVAALSSHAPSPSAARRSRVPLQPPASSPGRLADSGPPSTRPRLALAPPRGLALPQSRPPPARGCGSPLRPPPRQAAPPGPSLLRAASHAPSSPFSTLGPPHVGLAAPASPLPGPCAGCAARPPGSPAAPSRPASGLRVRLRPPGLRPVRRLCPRLAPAPPRSSRVRPPFAPGPAASTACLLPRNPACRLRPRAGFRRVRPPPPPADSQQPGLLASPPRRLLPPAVSAPGRTAGSAACRLPSNPACRLCPRAGFPGRRLLVRPSRRLPPRPAPADCSGSEKKATKRCAQAAKKKERERSAEERKKERRARLPAWSRTERESEKKCASDR
ncbi:hypothetical protein ACQJBY_021125 [Aegilops geniculata]